MDYSQVSLYALTVACVVASLSMILTLLLWKNFNRQLARIRVEKAQEEKTYREVQKALSAARHQTAATIQTAFDEWRKTL